VRVPEDRANSSRFADSARRRNTIRAAPFDETYNHPRACAVMAWNEPICRPKSKRCNCMSRFHRQRLSAAAICSKATEQRPYRGLLRATSALSGFCRPVRLRSARLNTRRASCGRSMVYDRSPFELLPGHILARRRKRVTFVFRPRQDERDVAAITSAT